MFYLLTYPQHHCDQVQSTFASSMTRSPCCRTKPSACLTSCWWQLWWQLWWWQLWWWQWGWELETSVMITWSTCRGGAFSGRALFKMRRVKETTNEKSEIFVTDAQLCVIWNDIFDSILVLYFITVKMQKWAVCWLPLSPPTLDVHPSAFAFTWTID